MKFRNLDEVDILNRVSVTHTVVFVDTVLKLSNTTHAIVVAKNPKHDGMMNDFTYIRPSIGEPNEYLVEFVTKDTLDIKGIKINSDDPDNIIIEVEMNEISANMAGETQ